MTEARRPGETWDAYAQRVGGCPPVDLQPGEGEPPHLRGWLAQERAQREARVHRDMGRIAEAIVVALADQGGAFTGQPLPRLLRENQGDP